MDNLPHVDNVAGRRVLLHGMPAVVTRYNDVSDTLVRVMYVTADETIIGGFCEGTTLWAENLPAR